MIRLVICNGDSLLLDWHGIDSCKMSKAKETTKKASLSNKGGKKRCILYWKVDSSNGTCSDARSINPNCIKTFSLMQRARFLEVTLGSVHTGLICKGLFTSKSWLYLSTIYLSLLELDFMNGRGFSVPVPGCGGLFFIWFVWTVDSDSLAILFSGFTPIGSYLVKYLTT